MSSAAPKQVFDDPVLQALAGAPPGPADPPEVLAAIREGQALGRFTRGAEIADGGSAR